MNRIRKYITPFSAGFAVGFLITTLLFPIIAPASACTADIGTATTEVYVRSADGEIAGSLRAGDSVIVTGRDGGWRRVEIGGTEYRVWGEYLRVEHGADIDGREVITRPRTSKDRKNGIKKKTKHSIRGSAFDGVSFW